MALVLRQYAEHKDPGNLRLHVWSNALFWAGLITLLSQVPFPVAVPLFGSNLGAWWIVLSAIYWLALDPLVPWLLVGWSALWALLPGMPWGPGHGFLAGVVAPLAVSVFAGLAALFSHIFHHEHAEYLKTDKKLYDALETTHALLWGPAYFWLCALLKRGYRPRLRQQLDAAERRRILRQERVRWSNWSGNVQCRPQVVCVPQTIDDLSTIVSDAFREGRKVRVVASGFTWAGWVPTEGTLVFCERLNGVEIDLADAARPAAWVECGTTNRELNRALAAAGFQVPWNVVLETVRVAGIVSVGTHGSGKETATMGDLIEALEVIDASGRRRILSVETIGAEGMSAARLGLGVFGIIARVRLRIEPAHRVLQTDRKMPIDEALALLPTLVRRKDSVELNWFPFNDWIWVRSFERTNLPLTTRRRFWFQLQNFLQMLLLVRLIAVFNNWFRALLPRLLRLAPLSLTFQRQVVSRTDAIHYRRWLELQRCSCVEIGFKVDPDFANVGEALMQTIGRVEEWAKEGRYPIDINVNLRFIGPSGALLAPAYGPGITCYIEALCLGRSADWAACSAELGADWMAQPTALPHWAKEFEHIPGVRDLVRKRLDERLKRFVAAHRASGVDPDGMFANRLVERMFLEPAVEDDPAKANERVAA
jgi:hypothetical protein